MITRGVALIIAACVLALNQGHARAQEQGVRIVFWSTTADKLRKVLLNNADSNVVRDGDRFTVVITRNLPRADILLQFRNTGDLHRLHIDLSTLFKSPQIDGQRFQYFLNRGSHWCEPEQLHSTEIQPEPEDFESAFKKLFTAERMHRSATRRANGETSIGCDNRKRAREVECTVRIFFPQFVEFIQPDRWRARLCE